VGFDPIPLEYLLKFEAFGFAHNLFDVETLNMARYTCKFCYSTDRERLYTLYLKRNALNHQKVLDFAPGKGFEVWCRNFFGEGYSSADLYRADVDLKADITSMDVCGNNDYDWIICSHILEHVDNDLAAMAELYRILKPGGQTIVMVPIITSVTHTIEDITNKDASFRWYHFGQEDHVRMYAKHDFIKKLESTGFLVNQYGVDYFGEDAFAAHGIRNKALLYIAEKK
jgi:SAM-dependent methyltransferase